MLHRIISRNFSSTRPLQLRNNSIQKQSQKNGKSRTSEESSGLQKDVTKEAEQTGKTLTIFQRFKKAYKEYGMVFIAVEIGTSIGWYALMYVLVKRWVLFIIYRVETSHDLRSILVSCNEIL